MVASLLGWFVAGLFDSWAVWLCYCWLLVCLVAINSLFGFWFVWLLGYLAFSVAWLFLSLRFVLRFVLRSCAGPLKAVDAPPPLFD